MMIRHLRIVLLFILVVSLLVFVGAAVAAQAGKTEPAAKENQESPPVLEQAAGSDEKTSVTHHCVKLGGKVLNYRATAGRLTVNESNGAKRCAMFFVAYELEPGAGQPALNTASRSVSFVFNGGPGASSIFLHLGALGPKRVLFTPEGKALVPPFKLVENDDCWLDLTDLVFIDPVETGFSRAVKPKEPQQFLGYKEDVESIGDFIRLYVTRNNRWESPKFVVGASYGGARSVGLARYLRDTHGMHLNGVVLISPVLDFQTILFDEGNELPFALFVPVYTAVAWHHGRLPAPLGKDLCSVLAQAEGWVEETYVKALFLGDALPVEKKEDLVRDLANYTGLSETFLTQVDGRIHPDRFMKELLRDQQRTLGRFDARFKGIDADSTRHSPEYDPSLSEVLGPLTSAMNSYVKNELQFSLDISYKNLNDEVVRSWKWSSSQRQKQGYLTTSGVLRDVMTQNSYLTVFLACGLYDLAAPYFAVKYTVNHMNLDKELRKNLRVGFYEAGHMFYTDEKSRRKFKGDTALFYKAALAAKQE